MKWEKIKTDDKPPELNGIDIDYQWHDCGLSSITLVDGNGGVVMIAKDNYSGFNVLIPRKPKMLTKNRLHGLYLDKIQIDEVFDNYNEATKRRDELVLAGNCASDSDSGLVISEIEVEEKLDK